MGEKHEEDIAEALGGRKTRGSGNQWRDQMDGRNNRYEQEFAWAWDCKSTLGKSITIPWEMIEKAIEQAGPERPTIPLRFYKDERLRIYHDAIIVVNLEDFIELNEAADGNDE
jgi:hypothetical protein